MVKKNYLWILPEEGVASSLQSVVRRLSQAFGGPVFLPHITLYSGFATSIALEEAARKIKKNLRISMLGPRFGDHFYNRIHCPCAPTDALNNLHLELHHFLGEAPPVYFPHLSLFYGSLSRVRVQDIVRGLNLDPLTFQMRALAIVSGSATVERWCLQSIVKISHEQ